MSLKKCRRGLRARPLSLPPARFINSLSGVVVTAALWLAGNAQIAVRRRLGDRSGGPVRRVRRHGVRHSAIISFIRVDQVAHPAEDETKAFLDPRMGAVFLGSFEVLIISED